MNSLPCVSVVVPCKNRARFLKSTLDSILAQNYSNIECLVVDGGSQDETIRILESYGSKIRWVSEPDRGQSDAINKGFRMSRGEIFTWLNADDRWNTPDAVNYAAKFLSMHPEADVVYGDSFDTDANGNVIGKTYSRPWHLHDAVEYCDHCIPQPASFMRREIFEKVGLLDEELKQLMDFDLWLRIGLVGKIEYLPLLLAYTAAQRGVTFTPGIADTCARIIQKFYLSPGIPPDLKKQKKRAISNAYLKGVQYGWLSNLGLFSMIKGTLLAFLHDLTNTPRIFNAARRFLKLQTSKN